MSKISYFKQTTQDTLGITFNTLIRYEKTPDQRQEFFLFLCCIRYSKLVYIIPLSGIQQNNTKNMYIK